MMTFHHYVSADKPKWRVEQTITSCRLIYDCRRLANRAPFIQVVIAGTFHTRKAALNQIYSNRPYVEESLIRP